jgi:hypothetical protein
MKDDHVMQLESYRAIAEDFGVSLHGRPRRTPDGDLVVLRRGSRTLKFGMESPVQSDDLRIEHVLASVAEYIGAGSPAPAERGVIAEDERSIQRVLGIEATDLLRKTYRIERERPSFAMSL